MFQSQTTHLPCVVTMVCVCGLSDWKQLKVNGADTTSVVIGDLEADEEYCVRVKSVSYVADSHFTLPLRRRVVRTGICVRVCFDIVLH